VLFIRHRFLLLLEFVTNLFRLDGRLLYLAPPEGPEFKRVMRATIIDTVWCNEAPNPAERRSSQLKADGDPALLNFPIMI
jgi:hypothetical protein